MPENPKTCYPPEWVTLNLTDAVAIISEVIKSEGGAPESSIHSWRCSYPDKYGPCSCVEEMAEIIIEVLRPPPPPGQPGDLS